MFARQVASRVIAQRAPMFARRSIHVARDVKPYGVLSQLPPNGLYMLFGTAAVSAVGIGAGVRAWLMTPEELSKARHGSSVFRY
ncbi:hypothetical protein DACRYDRAFT_25427 [Dacryopinax primogenitus]|uniref:Uncharacterized protein n=1 Tax=Dacryopinax primogenitus (strain DJM 731) TaxID=1858805 RepID=M5FUR8_DACPD|nr:uncharacterized protein DACRYDRAFT_25427 [Dacryopinax primogenitus]EJT97016.1 hypothetical protein DACRYDRAFT_25427 [Dacryopinax primogenitus]